MWLLDSAYLMVDFFLSLLNHCHGYWSRPQASNRWAEHVMSRYHLKVKPQYPLRTELLNLGKESNCDQVFSFFFSVDQNMAKF